ncbi:MAG TPA: tRNA lysidine(34) synthetase TilS [Myxococcota bacterium]|nr:tRNA lysidine(34) synthetase TilS [Myxococcota bacterium]
MRELSREAARLELTGQCVLVASSGGLDSTVLAHALAQLPRHLRVEVALAHVHHGLRGAEADLDAESVAALARELGVPLALRRVDPRARRAGRSSRARPTLQEAARELRYAALYEMAGELGASRIATAHHADDQVETVFLRLLRGTGPDGLAGIPERSSDGVLVRPLLRIPREVLRAYAASQGLAWREDASNASPRYARNRLRARWLPALTADFNPRLLRVVADLAEAQRRDSEWIATLVTREADLRFSREGAWLRIDATGWSLLPEALARRLAREALMRTGAGRHASRAHLERMLRFLASSGAGSALELPGGLRLVRRGLDYRLGPFSVAPGSAC